MSLLTLLCYYFSALSVWAGVSVLYFWVLLIGLGGGILGAWVSLEIGAIVVVMCGGMTCSRVSACMEYYFVQILSSLALISGMVTYSLVLIYGGLVLKFGMFPCLGWVYRVVLGSGEVLGFVFILGLQKLVPLSCMWNYGPVNVKVFEILCYFTMFSGLLLMLVSGDVASLVISSSFVHTPWIVLMSLWGSGYWGVYMGGYLLLLAGVGVSSSLCFWGVSLSALLTLGAVPPMLGFILKLFSVLSVGWVHWLPVLLLLLCGGVGMCLYSKPIVSYLLGVNVEGVSGVRLYGSLGVGILLVLLWGGVLLL